MLSCLLLLYCFYDWHYTILNLLHLIHYIASIRAQSKDYTMLSTSDLLYIVLFIGWVVRKVSTMVPVNSVNTWAAVLSFPHNGMGLHNVDLHNGDLHILTNTGPHQAKEAVILNTTPQLNGFLAKTKCLLLLISVCVWGWGGGGGGVSVCSLYDVRVFCVLCVCSLSSFLHTWLAGFTLQLPMLSRHIISIATTTTTIAFHVSLLISFFNVTWDEIMKIKESWKNGNREFILFIFHLPKCLFDRDILLTIIFNATFALMIPRNSIDNDVM